MRPWVQRIPFDESYENGICLLAQLASLVLCIGALAIL
jgi:hypothetical protein